MVWCAQASRSAEALRQLGDVLPEGARVEWVNSERETGLPYDLVIR